MTEEEKLALFKSGRAPFPPSAAYRWLDGECSAWLAYKKFIPLPETTSEAATRGINCHKKVEAGLKKISCDVILSDEDNEIVEKIISYIDSLPGEKHIEETVAYSEWIYGTPDLFIFTHNHSCLQIFDHKFGGMEVKAKNNIQLGLYALAIVKSFPQYKIKSITGTIIQPALNNSPSSHEYTIDELEEIVDKITHTVLDFTNGFFKFKVGNHCGYCEYKNICTQFLYHAQIQPGKITPAVIEAQLPKISALEQWVEELKSEAIKFLESGGELKDFKLTNRTMREFNEDNLINFLKNKGIQINDLYNTKLKTVNQIEKQLPFIDLNEFVIEKKTANFLKKK